MAAPRNPAPPPGAATPLGAGSTSVKWGIKHLGGQPRPNDRGDGGGGGAAPEPDFLSFPCMGPEPPLAFTLGVPQS